MEPMSVSFEHQSYRDKLDTSAENKFRTPKSPSRLRALARNVFRWWYIPLIVVLFAIYLAVRLGAIHWAVMTHKKAVDYANHSTVHDTSPTVDYGSRFLRELAGQEERPSETDSEKPEAEITSTDHVPEEEGVSSEEDESPLKGADYANLYTGARIYDFSQTANYGSKVYWRFMWQSKRSPDLVIEKPESYIIPGKCWPMRGNQGYVTIRLSSPISLSAVSYEHAPLSTLRPEDAGSAPKMVQISAGMDPKRLRVLGVHEFEEIAQAGQVTVVSVPPTSNGESGEDEKVQFLKFSVLDNFGERRFTCLYRIRVFGKV